MVACGFINLHHLRSELNLADVLSKHWGHQSVYETLLKPVLHHVGNVGSLLTQDEEIYVQESFTGKYLELHDNDDDDDVCTLEREDGEWQNLQDSLGFISKEHQVVP